jgi:hypothetical protein
MPMGDRLQEITNDALTALHETVKIKIPLSKGLDKTGKEFEYYDRDSRQLLNIRTNAIAIAVGTQVKVDENKLRGQSNDKMDEILGRIELEMNRRIALGLTKAITYADC